MALTTCTECGGKLSNRAAKCPHCGCPTHDVAPAADRQAPPRPSSAAATSVPPRSPREVEQPGEQRPVTHGFTAGPRAGLWYNPAVYMAVFGLVGGVVGWLLAELCARQVDEKAAFVVPEMVSVLITFAISMSIADSVMSRNWRATIFSGLVAIASGFVGMCSGTLAIMVDPLARDVCSPAPGPAGLEAARRASEQLFGGIHVAIPILLFFSGFALFATMTPAIMLRSWKRLGVGFAGGLVGCLSVWPPLFGILAFYRSNYGHHDTHIQTLAPVVAFVGTVFPGLVAGAAIGFIENAVKDGWLRVVAGQMVGRQIIIYRNPTQIGSSPQCGSCFFRDPQIAARHAAIHTVAGGYEIEDLQSATGTFVNGTRVSRVRLHDQDQVKIGDTILQFHEKSRTG